MMRNLLSLVFLGVCLAVLVLQTECGTPPPGGSSGGGSSGGGSSSGGSSGGGSSGGGSSGSGSSGGSGGNGGNGTNRMTSGTLYLWIALLITSAFISKVF